MSKETAMAFFQACEEGKGWAVCKEYCTDDASFSVQASPLQGISTIEGYSDWMAGVFTFMPNAAYEIKSICTNDDSSHVSVFAVFTGTHSEEGGPVPPTGKSMTTDYVYVMELSEGKVSHLTKIWNSEEALKQVGWQ